MVQEVAGVIAFAHQSHEGLKITWTLQKDCQWDILMLRGPSY